jgi:Fe-S-cluster-containing hydrogenase component 2
MTEVFWASYPPVRIVQAVLFWTALAGFVVIFPILTKKRTFCSLICPFGALATLCSKASLYKVSINPDKCTKCGRCGDVCPVFAIESGDGYRVSDFCNKCGRCMDICPAGAIGIYSGPGAHRVDARDLFIFLALLLAGVVSGLFVPHILLKLAGF